MGLDSILLNFDLSSDFLVVTINIPLYIDTL